MSGVTDGVGCELEQRLDVIGRCHSQRLDTADVACIPADLVGAVGPQADQFEIGVPGDGRDGVDTDGTGGPLNNAECHAGILPFLRYACRPDGSDRYWSSWFPQMPTKLTISPG